jgi:hypothetical protein
MLSDKPDSRMRKYAFTMPRGRARFAQRSVVITAIPAKRDLQQECLAHMEAQQWLRARNPGPGHTVHCGVYSYLACKILRTHA